MFSQRHLNLRTLVHTIHLHEGFTGGSHSTSAVAALCKSTEAPAASILVAKSFCKPITTPCSLLSQTFSAGRLLAGIHPLRFLHGEREPISATLIAKHVVGCTGGLSGGRDGGG